MKRPSSATLVLGLLQTRCSPAPGANLKRTLRAAERAARDGAQLVCTQELFRSQYFCQSADHKYFRLAETIPGASTAAFQKLAKKHKVVIIASLFEKRAAGVYHNTAAIIDADGSLLGIYRKMHIPDDPLYFEKFYFTPGDLGFKAWQTKHAKIGVLICWDQWFPEGARLTALQGAEILFYPTAIGWHPREMEEFGEQQREAWQLMQRAHAIANGVFVAAVNRVGHEGPEDGGLEFWGTSFVSDPFGVVLGETSTDREEVLVVTCDRARLLDVRRNWPFFRDRRTDAYADLTQKWGR